MATTYASKDVAKQVAEAILTARANGWTRPALQELSGFTPAQIWRAEGNGGGVHAGEVEAWTEVLTKIESGEVKPPEKAKSAGRVKTQTILAGLQDRIAQLEAQLAAQPVEAQA